MNVLIIGPKSIHVSSYIKSMEHNKALKFYLIAEDVCNFENVAQEFNVNFRSINPIVIVRNYYRLKKIIATVKPDCIHIHQLNRLAYFASRAAKALSIPILSTAWGTDVLQIPQQNKLYKYLVTLIIKRSVYITADAQSMIDAMQLIVPNENKYKLLQYGINPIQAGIKENIIYSNRLHTPLYRIAQVINYFNDFSKVHPHWKLLIAGDGIENNNLKKIVTELKLEDKIKLSVIFFAIKCHK
ncbi:MAG: glycosyltransferase, partial [Bacteroidia bacterium]